MLFSLITCTYNPNTVLLERLISSIENLQVCQELEFEWILVDNNSNISIRDLPTVRNVLSVHDNFHLIEEPKPGLTKARMHGIRQAKGSWIIFFDDDNEPENDYLLRVYEMILQYPIVSVWGPGNIWVHYIGGKIPTWLQQRKDIFQEVHSDKIEYSNNRWEGFYPAGTGLVIKREALKGYIDSVLSEQFSITDRRQNQLSSGGDTQMILSAIRDGHWVGRSGLLRLNHLIMANKTRFRYLCKLFFETSSVFQKTYNEVFTDEPFPLEFKSNMQILKRLYICACENRDNLRDPYVVLLLVRVIGKINGNYEIKPVPKPALLKLFKRIISFQ